VIVVILSCDERVHHLVNRIKQTTKYSPRDLTRADPLSHTKSLASAPMHFPLIYLFLLFHLCFLYLAYLFSRFDLYFLYFGTFIFAFSSPIFSVFSTFSTSFCISSVIASSVSISFALFSVSSCCTNLRVRVTRTRHLCAITTITIVYATIEEIQSSNGDSRVT